MKKLILFIGLFIFSSAFAAIDDSLEQICSVQGGTLTNLSQGGTLEFLTDSDGVIHRRFSIKNEIVNIDLNKINEVVKKSNY
ncbi:hypothetical protein IHC92_18910 [Photobacterium damselae subsp. damselae]|uniref:hypothetical protein n=1 Tax=Photobacterium damselae TaxID=38293 RepID=UPI001F424C37|nr:hypothetical protein [Photobacterium damselae]UKA23039.1 hypothetical protein IHC92_18910 [Photobacterium damselae subsp. damselae]